ncbi:MAG: aminotransferase class V-fold PLP-dependent enzyme [Acidobacteriota bacterium]
MTTSRHRPGGPPGPWLLDPDVDFLNHGSFGACPRPVLAAQQAWRERLEREPVRFFEETWPRALDEARARLAAFVGADADGLAFVTNATTGVNTVLRSLPLEAGDELLTTDHVYPACRNALAEVAATRGARLVVAEVPFPLDGPERVIDALLAAAGPRTRLVLVDHVTSPTALVFPVGEIVAAFRERGVAVLVDGAHAPGMLALDIARLGADFYTGNLHKWVCAPKGAGFLWVSGRWRKAVRPLVISHGAAVQPPGRSRFHAEFDWTGTFDPSPWLAVPAALDFLERALPGGFAALARRNRGLAREARRIVLARLGGQPPCTETMLGSMAALPLPDARAPSAPGTPDRLQRALWERHRIEVPVFAWPHPPRRVLRLSAQLYNERAQYERLAEALAAELARA